jgi:hypothetical protein
MGEKVVLPKFEIQSESVHPAIKAIATVAALLLGAMLILGWAVWHRRSQQMAAEQRRDAIIAARVAEANAVIEAAKAKEAEAVARAAAEQAKIAAAKAAAEAAAKAPAADKAVVADASSGHHHAHHHGKAAAAKGKGGAVASKDGDDSKKSAPKSTRDNAAIDKLLASFNK